MGKPSPAFDVKVCMSAYTHLHSFKCDIIPCYLYLKFYAKRQMGEKGWLNTLLLLLQTPVLCHEFWAFNFQKYPEHKLIRGPFCR